MRRLLLVPFAAALVAAGSAFAASPASAAPTVPTVPTVPTAVTCRPGVVLASSSIVSPRIVHAGKPMQFSDSLINCTAKWLPITIVVSNTPPKSCGPAMTTTFGPIVLKPHEQDQGAGGGPAPTCLGRYSASEVFSVRGKVVSRSSYWYTVIK